MLPTRLEMHNFIAYRAPEPIHFAGIELACLSGHNGVGKSSILDAITWALWGKARGRRDEELIHLGTNDMHVSIDFEQEGYRYRVRRRRARSGRGSRGALDLLVWGAGGAPRLINEDSIRGTQRKINEILRLDYDTFSHSAFLQQGRADAFTLKTPAERKRLLSDILNLRQWSAYEERAKEYLSGGATQIEIIKHDIRRIEEEIAREPQVKAEHGELSAAVAAAQATLDKAEARYDLVANSAAAQRREQESRREQENLIDSRQRDIAAAQAEIQRQDESIAVYQATIDAGDSIEAGYQQLLEARQYQSVIAEHFAQRQDISRQIHQVEGALAEERNRLTRQADVIRERINGLEDTQTAGAATKLVALQADVQALERLDAQRNKTTKELQRLKIRHSKIGTRLEDLKAGGTALNERLQRLELADGAICPLCGQELTIQHRDDMLEQLTADRDAMRQQYRDYTGEMRETKKERETLEHELESWAQQLKNLPALQQKLGAAAELSRAAEAAELALQLENAQLSKLEARLDSDDFGTELRAQLAALEAQREQVAIDPATHAKTKTQLDDFASFERQHTDLEFARLNLPEAQGRRAETAERLSKLEAALKGDQTKLTRILAEIEELDSKARQERELRAEVDRIRADVGAQRERKAIYEQELNAIAAGRDSKRRLTARLAAAQKKQSLHTELRRAFGNNGVPAMIIESAVPELEAEANELLARMTDDRMSLSIATQRERVSGGMIETLELEIADELGSRAYELYSGGEAFRINFAIRIALSKLLARRAGAQLRALFIDEGFGSQDEDGRDKLVDAINRIKSDFDLILVITHIDELRDAFPVHLQVEKTANGSQVTIR